jgi:hypothetical protein
MVPTIFPGRLAMIERSNRISNMGITMTSDRYSIGTLTRSLHKIHPGLVLPVIAVGGWLLAPALTGGDAATRGPIENFIATTGTALGLGPQTTEGTHQPPATAGAVARASAPAAGGGLFASLFGGDPSSGNGGGGGTGSGGGKSPQSQPQAQPQATSKPSIAPVHPAAATYAAPHLAAMPHPILPPNTPPVAVMPRPVMPALAPAVVVQAAPAPVRLAILVGPLLVPPFLFGRPPIGRAPVVVMRGRR